MTPDNTTRDPRVFMAAERTFLAWIRTGLALMGFGFVVARFGLFLRQLRLLRSDLPVQSSGVSTWLGTLLVALGVAVNVLAVVQHVRIVGDLNRGRDSFGRPSAAAIVIALSLALVGLAMAAYLIAVR